MQARAQARLGALLTATLLPLMLSVSADTEDGGGPHILRKGGRLVAAIRAEPRTLNPLRASDQSSLTVLGRIHADLLRIDRSSQEPRPYLAQSWTSSPDGRRYVLRLRPEARFSDGEPVTAADVVFSFQLYLDEEIDAPQRSLLMVGGEPVRVTSLDETTVQFDLAAPYAAAERLFDSFFILPRHQLEEAYREGRMGEVWGAGADPASVVGSGAFRLREHVPGERVVLEPNPHFWATVGGEEVRLPYLDELVLLVIPSEEAALLRFQAGEVDLLSRLTPAAFEGLAALEAGKGWRTLDLGPSLEQSFVFFNLNQSAGEEDHPRRRWFRQLEFRRALSLAVDRDAIVRLVYGGRATPLAAPVSPGNERWVNRSLAAPRRSLEEARALLARGGFTWSEEGGLQGPGGEPVRFTLITGAGNQARADTAAVLVEDWRQLGVQSQLVPLEFRSLLERLFTTREYDACLLSIATGDADPNPFMPFWISTGSNHVWAQERISEPPSWQREIDELMARQLVTVDPEERRRLFDRVQEILAERLPVIPLVSPHLLVAAKADLANLDPGLIPPHLLWNAEELYWRGTTE